MRLWYCAITLPNKEFEAKLELERRGFTTFLPCYLKQYQSRNKRLALLFRSYIFISLESAYQWPDITRLSVISHMLLGYENDDAEYQKALALPSEAIEKLREQSLALDEIRRGGPRGRVNRLITEGCYVRVKHGVFASDPKAQRALVEWSDGERATLILELFNRPASIEFYHKDLEKIE